MRHTILLFFILFTIRLQAQEEVFHIGGSGNLSSCWILNQNNFGTLDGFNNKYARRSELDYALTLGGGFGVMAGYNISIRHGLEVGLYFDKAGQKYNDDIGQDNQNTTPTTIDYVNVKRNVKLNYLKLPVLYKYELVPKRRSITKTVNYYFEVGPQFSYLMGVYEKVQIADPSIGNNLSGVPESEKFNKIDAGLCINNGIQIRLNKNVYLNTALNLYVGLIDINGKTIKDLEYFSKNDVSYKASHNFTAALNVGIHYIFVSRGYY